MSGAPEPLPAERSRARGWVTLAGGIISLVSLAAVAWWISRQQAPELPDSAGQLAWLVASVAVYGLATVLRGERWFWLLRRDGATLPRSDAYALTVIGYMGNAVLFARGGDAIRIYLAAPRAATRMRDVTGTLIAERLLDVAVLLALFVLLAYGVLSGIDTPDTTVLLIAAALLAVASVAIAGALRFAGGSERGAKLRALIEPLWRSSAELRSGHGLRMAAMTLAIWLAEAGTYLTAGLASGLDPTPIEALYLVGLIGVFLLIPSGPGYAGTLDATILFGAGAIGAANREAVSYLLTLRFVLFVPITVLGLVLLITRYGGFAAVRRLRAAQSSPD